MRREYEFVNMKILISHSKSIMRLFSITAASIAISMFTSCDGTSGNLSEQVKNDPAGTYRNYLFELRKQDNLSFEDLTKHIHEWQTLKDTVLVYIRRDTITNYHSDAIKVYERLHDSIRIEFSRLAQSRPRTYQELLSLKERVSPYAQDKELQHTAEQIRPFFISLDNHPFYRGDKKHILSAYCALLTETLRNGIHGADDLKTFIGKEDVIFRAFLPHIHEFDGADMSDITRDTERCCSQVFLAAERKEITYQEAMVYLAMRTNRRLIQSTQTCLDDILCKRVSTPEQAQVYIWMILQPYASLDGLCMAMLSPDQRKQLNRITKQTPDASECLRQILKSESSRLDELPGMLMEIFIHSL